MNKKISAISILILSAAIAATCFGQRRYTVTALPSPTSANNWVVWISKDGSTTFGVLWTPNPIQGADPIAQCYSLKDGQLTLYPTPGFSCAVMAVNDNLQFAGSLIAPTLSVPYTAFANLTGNFDPYASHLPGLDYTKQDDMPGSQSPGINDKGTIVGNAWGNGGPQRQFIQYSYIYSGGEVQVLPSNFRAFKINNNGDISGQLILPDSSTHAAIYRNGNIIDLGSLGGYSAAGAINSKGQVVGYSTLRPFDLHDLTTLFPEAIFYDGQQLQPIVVPGANNGSSADYLNDSGEIVGRYYPDKQDACYNSNGVYTCNYTHRAFYYSNGTAVDLNSLLVNPPAGLVLREVFYISNSGQILAGAPNNDTSWAPTYLLTPVDSAPAPPERAHGRK